MEGDSEGTRNAQMCFSSSMRAARWKHHRRAHQKVWGEPAKYGGRFSQLPFSVPMQAARARARTWGSSVTWIRVKHPISSPLILEAPQDKPQRPRYQLDLFTFCFFCFWETYNSCFFLEGVFGSINIGT